MRTIRRLIEAKKLEREENGEAGFSLIELIIVVVILGILVAIAIPIFGSIQDRAETNALEAAAANGATAAATALANPDSTATPAQAAASGGSNGIVTALDGASATTPSVDNICVKATKDTKTAYAGPGVAKDASGAITGCK